jgi:hypothetical protein
MLWLPRLGPISPVEFYGDFRGHFPERLVHFLGSVGQAICIDVYANATAMTLHVLAGRQSPDALFKVVTATRALKFDHVSIGARHWSYFLPS